MGARSSPNRSDALGEERGEESEEPEDRASRPQVDVSASGLMERLIQGAAGISGLHLASTFLAIATSIIMARVLGPEGYGIFAFVVAMIYLLGVPAMMGLDQLLVREVASYLEADDGGSVSGILRRSDQITLIASVLAVGGAQAAIWLYPSESTSGPMAAGLRIGLWAVPFLSLTRVRQSALQGLGRLVQGQIPETLALPLLFLLLVGGYLLVSPGPLSARAAIVLQVASFAGALIVAGLLLRIHLPDRVKNVDRKFHTRRWLRSAIPLVFVAGLHVVNSRTDTLMLAAFMGPEAVGIYSVAARGAGFVGFFLMAGQRAIAPTISRLYERQDMEQLQAITTTIARIILAVSTPLALILIFGGETILSLLYGTEFGRGSVALALLSVGYWAGVAMGPTAYLLVMTGHETTSAWGVGLTAVLNILLNALLIPLLGLTGAAIATGLSIISWNVAFVIFIRRRIGLRPTAFSL